MKRSYSIIVYCALIAFCAACEQGPSYEQPFPKDPKAYTLSYMAPNTREFSFTVDFPYIVDPVFEKLAKVNDQSVLDEKGKVSFEKILDAAEFIALQNKVDPEKQINQPADCSLLPAAGQKGTADTPAPKARCTFYVPQAELVNNLPFTFLIASLGDASFQVDMPVEEGIVFPKGNKSTFSIYSAELNFADAKLTTADQLDADTNTSQNGDGGACSLNPKNRTRDVVSFIGFLVLGASFWVARRKA